MPTLRSRLAILLATLFFASFGTSEAVAQSDLKTRNVVVIVTDGLRWQDVFSGPDAALVNREQGGVRNIPALRQSFVRDTPEESRAALLPFFWNVIARQGQLFGNRAAGSDVRVTNGLKFSYPGYNEMLTGAADPRIDKNDFGPNSNVTVFEWLNQQPEFRGRVAAFGTWEVFNAIFNRERAGIFLRAGWEPPVTGRLTPAQQQLHMLYRTTSRLWDDNIYDSLMYAAVLDHVRAARPRLLYIGFGETDEWAHSGRYDLYLRAAHQVDQFIRNLWDLMQSLAQYRGRTTFIVLTDHGRGSTTQDWKNHGKDVEGAESIWMAVLGPDTPALGMRAADAQPVTQSQLAATVAALLGKDYRAAFPDAAPPLAEVIVPKR